MAKFFDEHRVLANLAKTLRNSSEWPAGFSWNYTKPSQCAEGLCRQLTNSRGAVLDGAARGKIFIYADRFHPDRPNFADVKPAHVADLIEMHLQGKL